MLYLFAANEYALVEKAINKTVDSILPSRTPFNYVRYDFREIPFVDILNDAATFSFDNEIRVFIIDHASVMTASKEKSVNKEISKDNLKLLDALKDEVHFIFIVRAASVNRKNELFQFIEKNGTVNIEKEVDKNDWYRFVTSFFKRENLKITPEAISELVNRISDLGSFLNEAEKLALYGEDVTLPLVKELVTPLIEEKSYMLVNAFIAGDKGLALQIYEDFKVQNQEPTIFIAQVGNQFRLYAQVYIYHELGLTNEEIAQTLKVNSYRVKLAMDQRRKTSLQEVFKILEALADLDYKIKSGQIDRFYGFEIFLLNY